MASRNGYPWSPEEVQRLRELAAQGMPAGEIAATLDRTGIGIKSKALTLGITLARSQRVGSARVPAPHAP